MYEYIYIRAPRIIFLCAHWCVPAYIIPRMTATIRGDRCFPIRYKPVLGDDAGIPMSTLYMYISYIRSRNSGHVTYDLVPQQVREYWAPLGATPEPDTRVATWSSDLPGHPECPSCRCTRCGGASEMSGSPGGSKPAAQRVFPQRQSSAVPCKRIRPSVPTPPASRQRASNTPTHCSESCAIPKLPNL